MNKARPTWPIPTWVGIVTVVAALVLGVLAGIFVSYGRLGPWCPYQESCVPSYEEGGWRIEKVIP